VASINRKTIEYLAELARIRVEPEKRNGLLKDLENILKHFEELKELKTDDVQPVSGGTSNKNVLRDDQSPVNFLAADKAIGAFPEKQDGFLKIPPVFEQK